MNTVSENSLLGNVKRNTAGLFDRARTWASAKYEAVLTGVETLADDNNPEAHQQLLKIADDHSIPHDIETTKEELVERIREYLHHKHTLAG